MKLKIIYFWGVKSICLYEVFYKLWEFWVFKIKMDKYLR